MPLDGTYPRGVAAFLSSLSVTISTGRRAADRREFRQLRRAFVGLAARHAQFEKAPLGEQGQRLRRVAQFVPIKVAVDEEDLTIGEPGRARRGANRIRSLADQQGFVAGHEVNGRETAPERRGQLIVIQTQGEMGIGISVALLLPL